MYLEMRSCTTTTSLAAFFSEGALTGLTYAYQIFGRNELLMRFGLEPVSNKSATVRCVLMLNPTEMRTPEAGFWKDDQSARKSLRLSTFVLLSFLFCESPLYVDDFFMTKG